MRARTASVHAWLRRTAERFSLVVGPRAAENSSRKRAAAVALLPLEALRPGSGSRVTPHLRPVTKDNVTCDGAARGGLTLPAKRRLRRKSDFDAAYARGRRFGNGFFGVTALWNDKAGPRLGLAVAVRTAGGGVERNRIRRIIRESFRLHQHELPSVDLVVSMRNNARKATPTELRDSLDALWKTVAAKSEAPRDASHPDSPRPDGARRDGQRKNDGAVECDAPVKGDTSGTRDTDDVR